MNDLDPVARDTEQAVRLIARARDVTTQRNQAIAKLIHVHHLTLRDAANRLGLSHELVRRIANRTPQETT